MAQDMAAADALCRNGPPDRDALAAEESDVHLAAVPHRRASAMPNAQVHLRGGPE